MVTESSEQSLTIPSHNSALAIAWNEEEGLRVTLLYSRVTRQILCIETGKDFVDLLLGFLSLPLGCIVKLLTDANLIDEKGGLVSTANDEKPQQQKKKAQNPMSSIANLYASVGRMEETSLLVEKSVLLDPRPLVSFGGKLLRVAPAKAKKEKAVEYYCCGIACNLVSAKQGSKCPRHKRKMETVCKLVDEESEAVEQKELGIAKDGQYIITNSLEIYPSSALKSLMHLNVLKSERVSDLNNMDIFVGTEEVAKLAHTIHSTVNTIN